MIQELTQAFRLSVEGRTSRCETTTSKLTHHLSAEVTGPFKALDTVPVL